MNSIRTRLTSLIIATLFAMGLLVAPAHADGVTPAAAPDCTVAPAECQTALADCDETVQDLRNRLAITEAYRDRYLEKLFLAQNNLSSALSQVRAERAATDRLREELATTTARATDAELVAEQRKAQVQRKLTIIRKLRDQLRRANRR